MEIVDIDSYSTLFFVKKKKISYTQNLIYFFFFHSDGHILWFWWHQYSKNDGHEHTKQKIEKKSKEASIRNLMDFFNFWFVEFSFIKRIPIESAKNEEKQKTFRNRLCKKEHGRDRIEGQGRKLVVWRHRPTW